MLDYGRLVVDAWNLMRQNRSLWGLGLLATAGASLSNLVWGVLYRLYWRPNPAEPLAMLEQLVDLFERPAALVGVVVVFFVGLLLFWLVSTVAEGGLIEAAGRLSQGQAVRAGEALSAGVGQLGRLVALDTVLFLPLFLVLLVVMVGGTAVFAGAVLAIVGGTPMEDVVGPAVVGVLCLSALSFVTLPVTLVTLVFRQLAFRATVLDGLRARAAIGYTVGLLKRCWGHVLVVMMITWVLQYLLGFAFGLLLLPLSLVEMIPVLLSLQGGDGGKLLPLTIGVGLLSSLLVAGFNAILHSYSSTLWTLAYGGMRGEE